MRGEKFFEFTLIDDYPTKVFSDEYRYLKGHLQRVCDIVSRISKHHHIEQACFICTISPNWFLSLFIINDSVNLGIYEKTTDSILQQVEASSLIFLKASDFSRLENRFEAMAKASVKQSAALGNGVVSEAWLRTLTKNQQHKINL